MLPLLLLPGSASRWSVDYWPVSVVMRKLFIFSSLSLSLSLSLSFGVCVPRAGLVDPPLRAGPRLAVLLLLLLLISSA